MIVAGASPKGDASTVTRDGMGAEVEYLVFGDYNTRETGILKLELKLQWSVVSGCRGGEGRADSGAD